MRIVTQAQNRIVIPVDIVRGHDDHRLAHVLDRRADAGGNDRARSQHALDDDLGQSFTRVRDRRHDDHMRLPEHLQHGETVAVAVQAEGACDARRAHLPAKRFQRRARAAQLELDFRTPLGPQSLRDLHQREDSLGALDPPGEQHQE